MERKLDHFQSLEHFYYVFRSIIRLHLSMKEQIKRDDTTESVPHDKMLTKDKSIPFEKRLENLDTSKYDNQYAYIVDGCRIFHDYTQNLRDYLMTKESDISFLKDSIGDIESELNRKEEENSANEIWLQALETNGCILDAEMNLLKSANTEQILTSYDGAFMWKIEDFTNRLGMCYLSDCDETNVKLPETSLIA